MPAASHSFNEPTNHSTGKKGQLIQQIKCADSELFLSLQTVCILISFVKDKCLSIYSCLSCQKTVRQPPHLMTSAALLGMVLHCQMTCECIRGPLPKMHINTLGHFTNIFATSTYKLCIFAIIDQPRMPISTYSPSKQGSNVITSQKRLNKNYKLLSPFIFLHCFQQFEMRYFPVVRRI